MPIVHLLSSPRTPEELFTSLDLSSDVSSLPLCQVHRDYQPRYVLQNFMQENTKKKSLSLCRRGFRVTDAEGVATRVACGNSWLCPVCTPRKLSSFTRKSSKILDLAPSVLTFTLTQKQETGEDLRSALVRLSKTRTALTSGRTWDSLRKAHNIVGMGYVVELKHSPTGWHPHLHGFIISRNEMSQEQASNLSLEIRRRWVQHSSGASLLAQDVSYLDPEEFYETTRYLKKDHPRYTTTNTYNRTLGDLLHDASRGDVEALNLLHEAEAATDKKRRFSWTPGILEKL